MSLKNLLHRALIFVVFAINSYFAQAQMAEPVINTERTKKQYIEQLSKYTSAVFEENKGQVKDQYWQTRPDVLYYGASEGMNYYIKNKGMSYQLNRVESWKDSGTELYDPIESEKKQVPDEIGIYRVDVDWLSYNKNFTVEKGVALAGYNNYYNVPYGEKPALFVKQYNSVKLKEVWNGIDIHYYIKNGHLETDYLVAPEADYQQIKMEIKGADLSVDVDGYLVMKTPFGEIKEGKLKVYQNDELLEAYWKITPSSLEKKGTYIVSFDIPKYNPTLAMRIDPMVRIWGTYYGGTGVDEGTSVATDLFNNIFLAGLTSSNTLVSSGGYQNNINGGSDLFLVKFNSEGNRQWATYYGGENTESNAIVSVDPNGTIYLSGNTLSLSGIAFNGHKNNFEGEDNAFLVKFNTNGIRQWATYYGDISGSCNSTSIAVDKIGNVYLIGYTTSNDNIAINGQQNIYAGRVDAFLVKFNSNGVREWGTYFGGSTGADHAMGIALDNSGNIYISGRTESNSGISFLAHQRNYGGGMWDAFLAKFNENGKLLWSTYYGGDDYDWGCSVATDGFGSVYLSGYTRSSNNISHNGHQIFFGGGTWDAFLVKFNSSGVREWGTYYGGESHDLGYFVATDGNGNAYLTGKTKSTKAIATNVYQNTMGGVAWDAFLAKFSMQGNLMWGTYYGGIQDDEAYSLRIDANKNILLAGTTTSTMSISGYGHQNVKGVGKDAFLVKIKQPKIHGLVWQDLNENCQKEEVETVGLSGIGLSIQPGNYYVQSENGYWYIDSLPAGTYTARVNSSNNNRVLTCPMSQDFTVLNPNRFTEGPSFGFKNKFPCPKPNISVVMPIMRRGFAAQNIYIKVCNSKDATDVLENSYVQLTIPSEISIQSSSLPFTMVSDKYKVTTGDIYPGQCVNFMLNATIDLSSTANQTLCIVSELFPQVDCIFDSVSVLYKPNSNVTECELPYDNSLLKTMASCENDSVKLVVYNASVPPIGDMECYAPVRIFLDGLILHEDSVRLNSGDSSVYMFASRGQTWHIQVDKHPLNFRSTSTISSSIEQCGSGAWQPGLINELPQSDDQPILDIYCGQVSAPLDPNDKTGFPLGKGNSNNILQNQDIEYLIRFQNVGTDTAFNVVILDTLCEELDIFSIQSGTSSHPYDFRIYGQRVLEWRFNNIMLPDSTKDEPGSNGFVQFKVKQITDLPFGRTINNTAAIYFDFEDPVITNTYFHTITDKYMSVCGPMAEFNYTQSGLTVAFKNISLNADSIFWDFGDSIGYSNASDPTYVYDEQGAYRVCLYTFNSCGSNKSCAIFNITNTSALNPELERISIFPNPSDGNFIVKWNNHQAGNPEITITDALGKQVFFKQEKCVDERCYSIQMPPISSGIYFYHISFNGNKIKRGKLMIQQ